MRSVRSNLTGGRSPALVAFGKYGSTTATSSAHGTT